MRIFLSLAAFALLALGVLTACNSAELPARTSTNPAVAAAPQAADGVRRVTVTELKDLLAKNEAVVIDVRNAAAFDAGHIKGSKLIPEAELANHVSELPKDKLIVTYCSCSHEQTAIRAVNDLKTRGIENTAALLGGYNSWQSAGLPIETKQ